MSEIPMEELNFTALSPGMRIVYRLFNGHFRKDTIVSLSTGHTGMERIKLRSGTSLEYSSNHIYPDCKEMDTYFLLAEATCHKKWWYM